MQTKNDVTGFDTKQAPTRALIVSPEILSYAARQIRNNPASVDRLVMRAPEARLNEAIGLAMAIDLEIVDAIIVSLSKVRPATLFGTGKVEELKQIIHAEDVDLVVIDHALSPIQQRNLETAWDCKVLDRAGLILEIFSLRAKTREGRLQVELAHHEYQKSRLVRSWTHLERQRGGLGTVGGPGETQIESDRRQIQERINKIKKQLDTVTKTRALHRVSRTNVPYPIVALVGYTNAGKSTLFNRLSGADVMVEDMLFATLDPTMREIKLDNGQRVILSDTVGFISELPTHLIAAFRATLEEVLDADLIIHVRDIASAESRAQALDVENVLKTLGVGADSERHLIEVWNKLDMVSDGDRDTIIAHAQKSDDIATVSAQTGEGMEQLLDLIDHHLSLNHTDMTVILEMPDGKDLHWIYQNCDVIDRNDKEDGSVEFKLRVPPAKQSVLERIVQGSVASHTM